MESPTLNADDLALHVVSFGIDTYPSIAISEVRTRLNTFYEAASIRWSDLFKELKVSESAFSITGNIRSRNQPHVSSNSFSTFVMTSRGPVLKIPLVLPGLGETQFQEEELGQTFNEVRAQFFGAIPNTAIIRVGMIRNVVFNAGETPCGGFLTDRKEFAKAMLHGGQIELKHRDEKCNVNIKAAPVQLTKTEKVPVGVEVRQPVGWGLHVELDVNNHEIKELSDADIEEVVTRASGLWPDEILRYVKRRFQP